MKLLSFLLRRSRSIRHSRIIITASLVSNVISGLSNAALIALISYLLSNRSPATRVWVAGFLIICIIMPASRFLSAYLLARLTSMAMLQLRMQLSLQILSAPLRLLEELKSHRLLATITDDVPAITNAMTSIPMLLRHVIIIVGCIIYLGWLSWRTLLGTLVFLAIGVLSQQLLLKRATHYYSLAREAWDVLFKNFRALTEGTKELKLHRRRREAFLSDNLEASGETLRRLNLSANTISMISSTWGQALLFILIGLLLFVSPGLSSPGFPVLTAYVLTLLYMLTPLEVILHTLPVMNRASIAMKKIDELGLRLSMNDQQKDEDHADKTPTLWKRVELSGVMHAYKDQSGERNFVLGPVDLTFCPGEIIFLAGGNGSGKTTLAKLLTGLYVSESGEILLDGVPVTDELREHYRQHFSAVFSDFYIFDNLLGLDGTDLDARASEYLARLALDHKVQIKDGVFSTTDLSQGQRKRLALLTAYLEDRPIYVFDEWAADQDPVFKQIFYYHLLPELKSRGKTVFVVTHDDRYFGVADRVIKLDCGKIENQQRVINHLADGDQRLARLV